MNYPQIKEIKRRLRANETESEKLLWKYLRRRKLKGRKFIRQHAIIYETSGTEYFFFIPDFFCEAENLAIELDGKIHEYQKGKDHNREEILKGLGIRVLRFKNEDLSDMPTVLAKIQALFTGNDEHKYFKRKKKN